MYVLSNSSLCGSSNVDGNERQVEFHAVALRSGIDAVQVAETLGVDQRRNGAPGNAHRAALDFRPVRIQPSIAYDVERALAAEPRRPRLTP